MPDYTIKELKGMVQQEKSTFYKVDEQGKIISCPNLPSSPIFLGRYLSRGLRLTPDHPDLLARAKRTETKVGMTATAVLDYKCDVCGKEFTKKIALLGHQRSHKIK